jgi:hypothetical protein
MFESGRKNKPRKFQTLLHPPPHGLPPATRAAFGFALAIARTKALDWLAEASRRCLDPTPAVTVGHICAPSGLPQRPLCACCFKRKFFSVFLKKHLNKERKNKKK